LIDSTETTTKKWRTEKLKTEKGYAQVDLQGGPKTTFFTGRFFTKFAVKWILKIPPHFAYVAYVATLPCETLMLAKLAINDKLQGSVAKHLRCVVL